MIYKNDVQDGNLVGHYVGPTDDTEEDTKILREREFLAAYQKLCEAHGFYLQSDQPEYHGLSISEVGTKVWELWDMEFCEPRKDACPGTNFCSKCHQHFASHNADGSCVGVYSDEGSPIFG